MTIPQDVALKAQLGAMEGREPAKDMMRRQVQDLFRRQSALQFLIDNLPEDLPEEVDELLWSATVRPY